MFLSLMMVTLLFKSYLGIIFWYVLVIMFIFCLVMEKTKLFNFHFEIKKLKLQEMLSYKSITFSCKWPASKLFLKNWPAS